MATVITSQDQARKFFPKPGEAFIVDTFPSSSSEDQFPTEQMFDRRAKIYAIIAENVGKEPKPTRRRSFRRG